jgi:hypothetical protein
VVDVEDSFNSGVLGDSALGPGVTGESSVAAGLLGFGPVGVRGVAQGGTVAGRFEGDVQVTGFFQGDLRVKGDVKLIGLGQDLAEPFTVEGPQTARPGSVVVLTGPDRVRVSDTPYDPRVAGIVSGAGNLKPGIVLGRRSTTDDRPTIALTGKVWCYVDADEDPIELGDLLTTSGTLGHAMRATDQARAFGAVIGKALAGLSEGRGLIPVLVALR